MKGQVNFCDYFVLATGSSDRQVKAIAEGIQEGLSALGVEIQLSRQMRGLQGVSAEGLGSWLLLDMGDVVAHVFEPNAREFYGLEHLWQDAPSVPYKSRKRKN